MSGQFPGNSFNRESKATGRETDEKRENNPEGKKETDIPFNHYPVCNFPGWIGNHTLPHRQRLLEFIPPDPGH